MPMHLHQPVSAWLVVEIGMGKEVVKNNKGVLIGAKVAEIVNEIVASNIGKSFNEKPCLIILLSYYSAASLILSVKPILDGLNDAQHVVSERVALDI
ncbi:hypothetical protein Tco_1508770 [Tanacetum coccineum]